MTGFSLEKTRCHAITPSTLNNDPDLKGNCLAKQMFSCSHVLSFPFSHFLIFLCHRYWLWPHGDFVELTAQYDGTCNKYHSSPDKSEFNSGSSLSRHSYCKMHTAGKYFIKSRGLDQGLLQLRPAVNVAPLPISLMFSRRILCSKKAVKVDDLGVL